MRLSILVVRALLESVEGAGVSRSAFLAAAGHDTAWLEDGETRLSVDEYDRLVELAMDRSGDPALGLHMAETASATTYSLVAHLISYAKTMRQAVESYLRYHRLLTDRSAFRLSEEGPTATLVYGPTPGPPVCQRFHAELTLAGLHRMVEYFGGGEGVHQVSFEHPAPPHAAEYARLFRGVERFEQPTSGVIFDATLLDKPQIHGDLQFHSALESEARQRVSKLEGRTSYGDRVMQYLQDQGSIEDRREMSAAARSLGVSTRTLRRRLQEEGLTYGELAKKALAHRAERLVTDATLTIDETAYLLGFSDRSAFHRAFKRWTGMTPHEFRKSGGRGAGKTG